MLCVLTASAVLSACASAPADGHESASGDTPSVSSAAPQATATPEPAPEIVPAGETAALGDWEITVNTLTTQENYSMSDSEYNLLYYEPDEGNIYYVVNLSVKKLRQTKRPVSPLVPHESEYCIPDLRRRISI